MSILDLSELRSEEAKKNEEKHKSGLFKQVMQSTYDTFKEIERCRELMLMRQIQDKDLSEQTRQSLKSQLKYLQENPIDVRRQRVWDQMNREKIEEQELKQQQTGYEYE